MFNKFYFLLLLILNYFNVDGSPRIGYTNFEQRKWRKHHNSCGGKWQSPIKIDSFRATPLAMPALETVQFHNHLPGPLQLTNNGHSVSLSIAKFTKDDPYSKFTPYVFGAKLDNEYEMEGLHFHWGETNNHGSEHIFNDIRYPIEMHIIFRNRKYGSVAEALNYKDGLTVLGFFFQISEKQNKGLQNIVRELKHVNVVNTNYQLNETFTLSSLLPPAETLERFYTYKGSLTTPPCSEAVTWILFPDPMPITVYQMNKFRQLSSDETSAPMFNNYRHLQKLGQRVVYVRILKDRDVLRNTETVQHEKWDWLMNKKSKRSEEIVV